MRDGACAKGSRRGRGIHTRGLDAQRLGGPERVDQGRANRPWIAAVERGRSTLPEDNGRVADASLPKAARGSTWCCPYRERRMTEPVIPTQGG